MPSPGGPVSDLIPEPLASRLPSGSDSPAPIRPGHRSQLSPSSSEGSLQQMGMSATVVRNPNVVPAPAPAQAPRKSSETMEDSGVAIPVMVDSSPQDQPSVKEPANVKPVLTVQIPGAQNAFIPGEAGSVSRNMSVYFGSRADSQSSEQPLKASSSSIRTSQQAHASCLER